ncbi:helix-turn-helix domain-containing protein [Streptomyces sp. NBC_01538]|uniref:PucR family transcriptional regulator n=1 Tax=Streptomyces sp. NBC_01538 TaxID=2903897 RepID=UPI00386B3A78
MQRGVLPGDGVIRCDDHLSTLIPYADEPLVRALSSRLLAPLAGIPAPQRERLAETLLAWLQSESGVAGTVLRLHLHPQTVRYRMRQLEKLFGDSLRDSKTRFELELALRAGMASEPPRENAGRWRNPSDRRLPRCARRAADQLRTHPAYLVSALLIRRVRPGPRLSPRCITRAPHGPLVSWATHSPRVRS